MKILRLRFHNLNSLVGTHEIDFASPPLSEGGLFAITGPTGAGKSTLLDALTLALFGRAPRYREPNPGEVMSRHTGECWAEVEFTCPEGAFRSRWSVRRARGRHDGKLQGAERKVFALPAETVLTSKIDESNREIERLTGMDCERFLRSVMLAQGEFAAFLRASVTERTQLLEKVTGTEIYSRISVAAYETADQARQAYEAGRAQRDAVRVLAPEERAQRETLLPRLNAAMAATRAELERLTRTTAEAQRFRQLSAERLSLAKEEENAAAAVTAFAAGAERLAAHERASPFSERCFGVRFSQQALAGDSAKLAEQTQSVPQLAAAEQQAANERGAAQDALAKAEAAEPDFRDLWTRVTRLDSEIEALARRAGDARAEADVRSRAWKQRAADLEAERGRRDTLSSRLRELEAWLEGHAPDGAIEATLRDLDLSVAAWAHLEADLQRAELRRAEAARQEQLARAAVERSTKEMGAAEQAVTDRQTQVNALLAELTKQLEGKTLLQREDDRNRGIQRLAELQRLKQVFADHRAAGAEAAAQSQRIAELQQAQDALSPLQGARQAALQAATEAVKAHQSARDLTVAIQDLSSRRHLLVEGKPCPLCGALEHPHGSVPTESPDLQEAERRLASAIEAEKAAQAHLQELEREQVRVQTSLAETAKALAAARVREEAFLASVARLQAQLELDDVLTGDSLAGALEAEGARVAVEEQRLTRLREFEARVSTAREGLRQAEAALALARAGCEQARALAEQSRRSAGEALQAAGVVAAETRAARERSARHLEPFALRPESAEEAARALAALRERSTLYQRHRDELAALKRDSAQHAILLEEKTRQLLEAEGAGKAALASLEQVQAAHRTASARRTEAFGDRVVAREEAEFLRKLRALRDGIEAASNRHKATQAATAAVRTRIHELEQSIARTTSALKAEREALHGCALGIGFPSLEAMEAALLPPALLKQLSEEQTALRARTDRLRGNIEANERACAQLAPGAEADAAQLETLLADLQARRTEQERIAGEGAELTAALRHDDALRQTSDELARVAALQEREADRWQKLSALIGSANGTAFSRFAQGLTLDQLVRRANAHLAQLNRRYSVQRAPDGVLELQIVDHFQFDAVRPMTSLSGGESFLVSLALALGLSELASGRVAIESLFIDEGFGSLDAESLEVAMCALENLRTRGKTIGVISHVDAMKERIRTQIIVHKQPGGQSTLEVVAG